MDRDSGRHALIIGCGIAGPVLATFLRRCGVEVTMYESHPGPSDSAGSFLNLAPNGRAVLEQLGVADEVLAHGSPTRRILFHNHRDKLLADNPEATTCVKRGLLNKGLREVAEREGARVVYDKRLVGVTQHGAGGVTARFADGTTVDGDFLVGCDGINSATRTVALDSTRPSYAGGVGSGGFSRISGVGAADGTFRMTFGLRGFFGYQVVGPDEVYWFENHAEPEERTAAELAGLDDGAWKAGLVERHEGDHPRIREIIAATDGAIGRWPLGDLPTIPRWHDGDVCLVGDAAHAIAPHLGQGAALGMEDAIVLAGCLRDLDTPREAFARFEQLRRGRVEALVEQARRTGGAMTPTGPIGRFLRDLVLPFFIKKSVQSAFQVYEYRVDWSEPIGVS